MCGSIPSADTYLWQTFCLHIYQFSGHRRFCNSIFKNLNVKNISHFCFHLRLFHVRRWIRGNAVRFSSLLKRRKPYGIFFFLIPLDVIGHVSVISFLVFKLVHLNNCCKIFYSKKSCTAFRFQTFYSFWNSFLSRTLLGKTAFITYEAFFTPRINERGNRFCLLAGDHPLLFYRPSFNPSHPYGLDDCHTAPPHL